MGKHLIEISKKELVSIELILSATHENGMTTIIRKDVLHKVTYQDPNGLMFSEIKEFNRELSEQERWKRDTKITLNF
jgi:hypothetical protein